MRMTLALTLALLAPPQAARAATGAVDWQQRVVRCTGAGAPNLRDAGSNVAVARIGAEKAARLDALRTCLEAVKGITVSGGQTVGGAMGADAATRGSVEGAVRGFTVAATRYFSDGGVEVDVVVPLDGALGEAVLPRGAVAPAGDQGTSVVIDARGQRVVPALAPRVLDEAGNELYGASALGASARRGTGVAAYAHDLEAARRELAARVGDRPVVLRSLRAQGTDLVLSDEDARKLAAAPAILAEGRVVILTD
jgi:hypothetical protein